MEWNGNFGMEYGRFQNGMEDFKNGIEGNLPSTSMPVPAYQFHSLLDFARGIYREILCRY